MNHPNRTTTALKMKKSKCPRDNRPQSAGELRLEKRDDATGLEGYHSIFSYLNVTQYSGPNREHMHNFEMDQQPKRSPLYQIVGSGGSNLPNHVLQRTCLLEWH